MCWSNSRESVAESVSGGRGKRVVKGMVGDEIREVMYRNRVVMQNLGGYYKIAGFHSE